MECSRNTKKNVQWFLNSESMSKEEKNNLIRFWRVVFLKLFSFLCFEVLITIFTVWT